MMSVHIRSTRRQRRPGPDRIQAAITGEINTEHNPAFIICILLTILTTTAAATGLFIAGLYKDPPHIILAWKGNDLITLLLVLPVFILCQVFSFRGSAIAAVGKIAAIAYLLYNYAFYLFGAHLNALFFAYAAIVSLSVYGLVITISAMRVSRLAACFAPRTPVQPITVYLFLVALILLLAESGQVIHYYISGELPAAPQLIFALDLSLVVPTLFVSAYLLLRRTAWGYMLACMMLFKGFAYGLVLILNSILIARSTVSGEWDPLLPFYISVAGGGLGGISILIRYFQPENLQQTNRLPG